MKLSIVTINYNNAKGLRKTLASVAVQTYPHVEHIIVDGGSSDNSVDVIKEYVRQVESGKWKVESVVWVSEKDSGIYNAMNKGICKTTGEYIQILNSGDVLAAPDVTERMFKELEREKNRELVDVPILYGNMVRKNYATDKLEGKSKEVEYSLRQYYSSTMNHDCCYIHRSVYEKYGLYDESLKIVSDWKWFLQTIGLGKVKPIYADIDVTIFDCSGISETNLVLRNKERRQVLEELLPPAVLADYDMYSFPIEQYRRLKKYHLWGLTWFVERVLFKLEKWYIL
jgi:glycosyltransferase involved in cell wall biosynthesis